MVLVSSNHSMEMNFIIMKVKTSFQLISTININKSLIGSLVVFHDTTKVMFLVNLLSLERSLHGSLIQFEKTMKESEKLAIRTKF